MLKTALPYIETALVTLAVSVPVRYLGGLEWPWAIAIGLVASTVLRALIHRKTATHKHDEAGH